MRKILNLFAFSTLAVAAVMFAGCGNTDTGGGSDDAGSGTTATSNEDGGSPEDSDSSSTTGTSSGFQMVTLNVPKMT